MPLLRIALTVDQWDAQREKCVPPLDQLRAMPPSSGSTHQGGAGDAVEDECDSGAAHSGAPNTLERRGRRSCTVRIHLASCKYTVCESSKLCLMWNIEHRLRALASLCCTRVHHVAVREVRERLGWVEADDDASAHVFWCDTSAGTERLSRLTRPQKLNHFPGMLAIARKKGLARCLAGMRCGAVLMRPRGRWYCAATGTPELEQRLGYMQDRVPWPLRL